MLARYLKVIIVGLLLLETMEVKSQLSWLQPSNFHNKLGDSVFLHFKGEGLTAYKLKSLVWCNGRTAKDLMDEVRSMQDSFAVPLSVPSTQTVVAVMESDSTTMTAGSFNALLKENGFEDLLAERVKANQMEQAVTVRTTVVEKSIFQVGYEQTALCNAAGDAFDLFLVDNPYEFRNMEGYPNNYYMRLRGYVSLGGQPLAKQKLVLYKQKADLAFEKTNYKTNKHGECSVLFDIPGNYILNSIYIEKDADHANAYHLYKATVNFGSKGNFFVKRRVKGSG